MSDGSPELAPLGDLLLRTAGRYPDTEALVFPDARLTYAELAERATSIARSLVGLGIRPGEHVGILMGNHPDVPATLFGVALAGAVGVPINVRYRQAELSHLVRDADLVAVVTHDATDDYFDLAGLIGASLPGLATAPDAHALDLADAPRLRFVATLGTHRPPGIVDRTAFEAAAAEVDDRQLQERREGVSLDQIALVVYTSGTTAQPRGAMITHRAFTHVWLTTGETWRTKHGDRQYNALPLFHVTALGSMVWAVGFGATFLSDRVVDPGRTLDAIERERVTQFFPAYPPVMEALINHPRFAEADLSSIQTFLNVAPPETLAKFQSRIPHAIQLTTYGGTEGGPVTLNRLDDPLEVRIGTCGAAQPGNEIRICGPDGDEVPPGVRGEIQIRGTNVFSGYYNHPEKDAETFVAGGWARTGDIGVSDEHGRVRFLGRTKEMLKVGGENVAPQEIEEQLSTHPAVGLVQVVGIPDERLVEVPAAFVELVPGSTVTEVELAEHLKPRIASFKVPRVWRFITEEEWPMSATKIQRFRLRERLLAELRLDPADAGAAESRA